MSRLHFRDQEGRPVSAFDVDSADELDQAVIHGPSDRRWIVDIQRTGATCRTCNHDCVHGERVERALKEADLLPRGV